MTENWPYSLKEAENIGTICSVSSTKDYSNQFKKDVAAPSRQNSYDSRFIIDNTIRDAEFFGIKSIENLIAIAQKQATVVGIRVYYGLAYEKINPETGLTQISTEPIEGGDPEMRPRLFLVAVDEKGNDIMIGLGGNGDDPNGNGLGGGSPQPPYGQN
ncbi:hypothetical protein [Emticicia sp. 21SJ11W-3]|uniref:hypothetical protein n=1 Tax=Emticicia sp. 21SJ11W-3 TaxID=2916755 RepID=UPI00209D9368|nr:hypothetical protein [Emticicia sp. 21SJ11W-3]UTA69582.1 hypothetical protein MB380_07160 [Emticicia sp. 21SJ11W-3]